MFASKQRDGINVFCRSQSQDAKGQLPNPKNLLAEYQKLLTNQPGGPQLVTNFPINISDGFQYLISGCYSPTENWWGLVFHAVHVDSCSTVEVLVTSTTTDSTNFLKDSIAALSFLCGIKLLTIADKVVEDSFVMKNTVAKIIPWDSAAKSDKVYKKDIVLISVLGPRGFSFKRLAIPSTPGSIFFDVFDADKNGNVKFLQSDLLRLKMPGCKVIILSSYNREIEIPCSRLLRSVANGKG